MKKSIAMLLVIGLMLSLCGGAVFAQEETSQEPEKTAAYADSGGGQSPEEKPSADSQQGEATDEEEAVDVEAILAERNADIDVEAIKEEMLELYEQKKEAEERYLSQLSKEELREMQERTEKTLALFATRAEAAAAAYEESLPEQEELSSRASHAFSIAQGSIAIQDGTNAGTIKVTQGSTVKNNLNPSDTIVVITGTSEQNYVLVSTSSNRTVKITLAGVNMNNIAASTVASCITLSESSVVNLTLNGDNRIFAKQGGAGIEVPEGASLTVGGTGSLDVTAGNLGASIGGYSGSRNCGNITISSGTIVVNSYDETGIFGSGGAGIGGGFSGGCGVITINGGRIRLQGPFYISPGIGTGSSGSGGSVIINGGMIEDTNEGTTIGSGSSGSLDSIDIRGGTITALTGGYIVASIGSGHEGNVNSIKISKGTIHALSSSGAGIGAGMDGSCGSITITGGDITAESTLQGAGIGGGVTDDNSAYGGICSSISISNATVNASGNYGAGIGGGGGYDGKGNAVSSITITSGTVNASSYYASAIGGGYGPKGNGADGTINIGSSANVTAVTRSILGAINHNSGSANVLNFKLSAPSYSDAVLKNSSGNTVRTIAYSDYSSFGSFAMTVPAGNYTLFINDEKLFGARNNAFTSTFNAARGINTYENVRPDLSAETLYGRLGFAYPVDSQYTGIFDYAGHLGLDISAPKNSPIYSIDAGKVTRAGLGANNGETTGYYIVVINDTLDPTKATPSNIITRYLHINTAENVKVHATDRVSRYQEIGLVGSRGYYKGTRLNHLHIDANSSGITDVGPGSAYISPNQFWPGRFHNATSSEEYPGYESDWGAAKSTNSPTQDQNSTICNLTDQELLELGGYYDICLIKLIGSDKFESWLRDHPYSNVYDLIEDFAITDEQLRETLAPDIYDAYKAYWPLN